MNGNTDVYCSTCFAMPGESCVDKYVVHGEGNVTPVICPTHGGRIVDSERAQSFMSQKAPQ